jgi:hypothetical protein
LLSASQFPDHLALLTPAPPPVEHPEDAGERVRLMWGQDLLRDLLDGRYRTVICGVNDHDNTHSIIAKVVDLIHTSQWTASTVTSYARTFQASVASLASGDKEPYILKFDLDSLLVLGILRPRGRDHFTLHDLARGFKTIHKMLRDRRDRGPVASVSFLNAKANLLVGPDGREPPLESVLRVMFESGFRGDLYMAPPIWKTGEVGVFPSYPYPQGLDEMRKGSS